MTNEFILAAQIISLVVFVGALFIPYKVLVEQKDAVIGLLKERIAEKDAKLEELQKQTPDALAKALSSRVQIALSEITRLQGDSELNKVQIAQKESELKFLSERLQALSDLIKDADLVCPTCAAPLIHRGWRTIYGYSGNREVEADVEYRGYECGYSIDEEKGDETPCRGESPRATA